VLIALREALRRREVYVQGAGRWKDPDEDLPGDFEDNRDVHYSELGKPLAAAEFTGSLRKRLTTASPGSTRPWPGTPAAASGSSRSRAARG
jgi:hypothetical protein